MTELVEIVAQTFGFQDINDNKTEIGQAELLNAIPKLHILEPLLIETYKSTIKDCFKSGLTSHKDTAKLLRRILKQHYKALIWRRTTTRNTNGKCVSCYKYRMC